MAAQVAVLWSLDLAVALALLDLDLLVYRPGLSLNYHHVNSALAAVVQMRPLWDPP